MTDNYWLNQACSNAADLEKALNRVDKLETVIEEIKLLMQNHDVIACTNGNKYASVSPKKLNEVLEKLEAR